MMGRKTKEELLAEQNELLKRLVANLEDIKDGKVKPFRIENYR